MYRVVLPIHDDYSYQTVIIVITYYFLGMLSSISCWRQVQPAASAASDLASGLSSAAGALGEQLWGPAVELRAVIRRGF